MDEYDDKLSLENINTLKRKRQKTSYDHQPSEVDTTHWKVLPDDIADSEFFEQMGIGMLDSEESSSCESKATKQSSLEVNPPTISTDAGGGCGVSSDDEKNRNTDVGGGASAFSSYIDPDLCEYHAAVMSANAANASVTSVDVYTDPVSSTSVAIRSQKITKIVASANSKKRSPLTTVSNNNNIMKAESIASKKFMHVLADERFFAYKKEQIEAIIQPNYFELLADEIILQIFKWLPKKALLRCSLVSKQFNRVAQDDSLWTRIDLGCRKLRKHALGTILNKGVVIMRLSQVEISEPLIEPTKTLEDIKLQYLDLSMAIISTDALTFLLSKCRYLLKLSLEHVAVNTSVCYEIAENKNLEALNLTMCEGVTARGLERIVTELKVLRSINISWTYLDGESVKGFVENITPTIMQLNIAGCRKTMSNLYVSALVDRCPDLLELDLSDCTSLTSNAITFISKLEKLEYLSLSRCYNINVNSYFHLTNLKSLLYLDVFGLMNDQATQMLQVSLANVGINKFIHSSVARPTVGTRRTSIWGLKTRD